jgi:uncharacterized membrane protein YGL010W
MRSLQQWFDEYAVSHQNPVNKNIHWICVPLIFYSIIGLLSELPAGILHAAIPESLHEYAHWGTVAVFLALAFYVAHSVSMAIGILLFSAVCLQIVVAMQQFPVAVWQSSLGIFVLAWIGQFYGHKIEGKKPSFLNDIQFLLIGPAWLMSFIYKRLRIKY